MKTDARVRYTRMRIKEAFFQLLENKALKRITVKEVCDLSEINRATFYKHYIDIFDLMEKIQEEYIDSLRQMIQQPFDGSQQEKIAQILKSVRDSKYHVGLLCGENGDPEFAKRIVDVLYQEYIPIFEESLPNCSPKERKMMSLFIQGGSVKLLSLWIIHALDVPPEEVTQQLFTLCGTFLGAFRPK